MVFARLFRLMGNARYAELHALSNFTFLRGASHPEELVETATALGYEALAARKPDLVYVSISGYGDSGPYRDRRVYDPIIQGLTGHVGVQKNPDIPIPDLVRNVVAAVGYAIGLLHKWLGRI